MSLSKTNECHDDVHVSAPDGRKVETARGRSSFTIKHLGGGGHALPRYVSQPHNDNKTRQQKFLFTKDTISRPKLFKNNAGLHRPCTQDSADLLLGHRNKRIKTDNKQNRGSNCVYEMNSSWRVNEQLVTNDSAMEDHDQSFTTDPSGYIPTNKNNNLNNNVSDSSSTPGNQQSTEYVQNLEPDQIDMLLGQTIEDGSEFDIIGYCMQALECGSMSTILKSFLVACKYKFQDIAERLKYTIRKNFMCISQTKEFLSLPLETVLFFMEDTFLNVENELDMFATALAWIDYNKQCRIPLAGQILKSVRYVHIAPDDIARYVEPNLHLFTGQKGAEALLNLYKGQCTNTGKLGFQCNTLLSVHLDQDYVCHSNHTVTRGSSCFGGDHGSMEPKITSSSRPFCTHRARQHVCTTINQIVCGNEIPPKRGMRGPLAMNNAQMPRKKKQMSHKKSPGAKVERGNPLHGKEKSLQPTSAENKLRQNKGSKPTNVAEIKLQQRKGLEPTSAENKLQQRKSLEPTSAENKLRQGKNLKQTNAENADNATEVDKPKEEIDNTRKMANYITKNKNTSFRGQKINPYTCYPSEVCKQGFLKGIMEYPPGSKTFYITPYFTRPGGGDNNRNHDPNGIGYFPCQECIANPCQATSGYLVQDAVPCSPGLFQRRLLPSPPSPVWKTTHAFYCDVEQTIKPKPIRHVFHVIRDVTGPVISVCDAPER